jgi:hypothetical protein
MWETFKSLTRNSRAGSDAVYQDRCGGEKDEGERG